MRVSNLPIKYYDVGFLTQLGNRIGRTVKVDNNTLQMERGKCARLCVEVDLRKPLVPMFEVKSTCIRLSTKVFISCA